MKVITLFFIILVFGTCNAMDSEKTPPDFCQNLNNLQSSKKTH